MDHRDQTRARVGASALRVLNSYGEAIALEIYKGGFAALVMVLVTFMGREATKNYFYEILGELKPPRTKPTLITNNGEEVA